MRAPEGPGFTSQLRPFWMTLHVLCCNLTVQHLESCRLALICDFKFPIGALQCKGIFILICQLLCQASSRVCPTYDRVTCDRLLESYKEQMVAVNGWMDGLMDGCWWSLCLQNLKSWAHTIKPNQNSVLHESTLLWQWYPEYWYSYYYSQNNKYYNKKCKYKQCIIVYRLFI